MSKKYILTVLVAVLPTLAFAQGPGSYDCNLGDLQRRVEILTEPGVSVPCEVHYFKVTEAPGEREVLWSAASEAGYCEKKVDEFIAKLEGWGWDCGGSASGNSVQGSITITKATDDSEAPAETESVDDTEALAPVDATEAVVE